MAVQVFPFIYTALFLVLFTVYSFCSGAWLDVIDYVFFVSPIVVLSHLVYSRMLLMCAWHRVACALPIIPQSVDLFDTYIYHFEHGAWVVITITLILTTAIFMVAIYKVFFTENGRFGR